MDLTATPGYVGPSRAHRGRPTHYTAGPDTYLGIQLAAKHLGVSRWTLRLWMARPEKNLRPYTIGGWSYWKQSELDQWIKANRTPRLAEPTPAAAP